MPIATIKAYRRPGGAVVTIQRQGHPPRRYHVSLKRYHALREWAASRGSRVSGAWSPSGMAVSLWENPSRKPAGAGMEVSNPQTA